MRSKTTIGLMLTAILLFVSANAVQAQNVTKEIKVDNFNRMDLTTVGVVYFTQGAKHSVKIEGKKAQVDKNLVSVKGGTLYIEPKEETLNAQKDGINIYITAPSVEQIVFCGVGMFQCNEQLKADDLKCTLEGVGKMEIKNLICHSLDVEIEGVGKGDIHVQCDELKAEVAGIGSLTLSGKAKRADISRDGIGSVNTSNLEIID